MVEYVEVNVSEIEGAALDWAMAQAEDLQAIMFAAKKGHEKKPYALFGSLAIPIGPGEPDEVYSPSSCWHCVGPLIALHRMTFVDIQSQGQLLAVTSCGFIGVGESHIVAACRAALTARVGTVVSVPSRLISEAQNG